MIEEIKNGLIKRVIIYKLDRLSRSVVDTYNLINIINKAGCQLIAVMDHLDISTSNGKMIIGMLSVIAEWEQNVISERTLDGLSAKASKGEYPFSNIPYGWNKDCNGLLSVNDEQALILNDMADMYIDGCSMNEISKKIDSKYHILMNDWNQIKRLITREWNIGKFIYREQEFRNVFPPIMDKTKYERILKAYTSKQINDAERFKYLFHSKVYCTCGKPCEQSSSIRKKNNYTHKYFYYVCPECKKRVNQDDLLSNVAFPLLKHSNEYNPDEETIEISKKFDDISDKKAELVDMYLEHEIDASTYIFSISELQNKQKELENQLKVLKTINVREFYKLDWSSKKELIDRHIISVTYDMEMKTVVDIKYKK